MTYSNIVQVRNYPYPSTIEISFSHSMVNNTALTNPDNYYLNHGAYVTSVSVSNSEVILLHTENLFGYKEFLLSIGDGLVSVDGYALDNSNAYAITLNAAEDSINAITAANGRLKSGQSAKKVFIEGDYFYILTESGLDVVDRASLFNKGYVLQQSGFNTIFVYGD